MPKPEPAWQTCGLCQRDVPPGMVTLHHLTPKQKGGKGDVRTPLCRPCHNQVHAVFANNDLARAYADLPSLRQAVQLQAFLQWVRKQRPEQTCRTVMSNDHPRRRRRSACR